MFGPEEALDNYPADRLMHDIALSIANTTQQY